MKPQNSSPAGPQRTGTVRIRSGITIIEVLLSLTLTSTLMAGAVALVSLADSSSDHGQANFRIRQNIRRLADDFRRDIRSAARFQLRSRDLEIVLADTEQVIKYSGVADVDSNAISEVTRQITRGGGVEGLPERYLIGTKATVSFAGDQDSRYVECRIIEDGREDQSVVILAAMPPRNEAEP